MEDGGKQGDEVRATDRETQHSQSGQEAIQQDGCQGGGGGAERKGEGMRSRIGSHNLAGRCPGQHCTAVQQHHGTCVCQGDTGNIRGHFVQYMTV